MSGTILSVLLAGEDIPELTDNQLEFIDSQLARLWGLSDVTDNILTIDLTELLDELRDIKQ